MIDGPKTKSIKYHGPNRTYQTPGKPASGRKEIAEDFSQTSGGRSGTEIETDCRL